MPFRDGHVRHIKHAYFQCSIHCDWRTNNEETRNNQFVSRQKAISDIEIASIFPTRKYCLFARAATVCAISYSESILCHADISYVRPGIVKKAIAVEMLAHVFVRRPDDYRTDDDEKKTRHVWRAVLYPIVHGASTVSCCVCTGKFVRLYLQCPCVQFGHSCTKHTHWTTRCVACGR